MHQTNSNLSSDSLGSTLVAVAWVFAVISFVVIAIRAYVRLRIVNRFQIDDWLIIFTYVCEFLLIWSLLIDSSGPRHLQQYILHYLCPLGAWATHPIPHSGTDKLIYQIRLSLRVLFNHVPMFWAYLVRVSSPAIDSSYEGSETISVDHNRNTICGGCWHCHRQLLAVPAYLRILGTER
jgi:hypothetical protein